MTDETEKRPAPISYRPPKGREADFDALVAASGLSVNAFINARIFGSPRVRPEKKKAARKLCSAAAIADNLHEIGLLGDARIALIVEATFEELDVLRGDLFDEMGRKP